VLVANAGITRDKLLLMMTDEDFGAVLETNWPGRTGWPNEPRRR
jgi:3-oxoacyl-[acyl-carrier protein] reductase